MIYLVFYWFIIKINKEYPWTLAGLLSASKGARGTTTKLKTLSPPTDPAHLIRQNSKPLPKNTLHLNIRKSTFRTQSRSKTMNNLILLECPSRITQVTSISTVRKCSRIRQNCRRNSPPIWKERTNSYKPAWKITRKRSSN